MSFKPETSLTPDGKVDEEFAAAAGLAGPSESGPKDRSFRKRLDERWSLARCAFRGLRMAWVSVASLVVGTASFCLVPQVQDLFMEVTGTSLTSLIFWIAFYIAVVAFWAFPIYLSSRWILSRFEEGAESAADPEIKPVKPWVVHYLPPILTAACFAAVLLGQLMALANAPSLFEGGGFVRYTMIQAAQQDVAIAVEDATDRASRQCAEGSKVTCFVAKSVRLGRIAVAFVIYLAKALALVYGSEKMILAIYAILAAVIVSLWLRRWLISRSFNIGGAKLKLIWRLVTLVIVLALLLLSVVAASFAAQEWSRDLSLGHMVLLPGFTGWVIYLAWQGLKPGPKTRVTVAGRLMSYVNGINGVVDEATATERIVRPLYILVAIFSVAAFLLPFVLHPAAITATFLHRASLLPLLLGLFVAPLTYVSHWSIRCKAPLVLLLVLTVNGATLLFGDTNDVRTVVVPRQAEPHERETLQQEIERWASINGCKTDTEENARACPAPFIVSAAGGASRAAFQVAGTIGKIMDQSTQKFYLLGYPVDIDSSADGSRIVANFEDVAFVWDSAAGNVVRVLRGKGRSITSSAISPDGKLAVTGIGDGTAVIWDVATGGEIGVLKKHEGWIRAVAFSSDGKLIATGSDDETARIWDVATGRQLHLLRGHTRLVGSVSFSPDSSQLVTAGFDPTPRVWNVGTGDEVRRLQGHRDTVHSAIFNPAGGTIVTSSADGTTRIWDASTGIERKSFDGTRGASPTRDGKHIVLSDGLDIRILDIASGSQSKEIGARGFFHTALSRDGRFLLTMDLHDSMQVRDLDNGGEPHTLQIFKLWEAERFDKQLFAISGVSGGSLGAIVAYAAISDSQRRNDGGPPCRDSTDTDWFAPYVKSTEPSDRWQAQTSWRGCLQLLVSGDFLSPVMLALGTTDILPSVGLGDRVAVLEQAWEKRYERITGYPTLEEPLIALRQRASENGHWLPVLLLNGTSVTTGRRIITSDVETIRRIPPTNTVPIELRVRTFQDAYDFRELTGQPKIDENRDLRISTAAATSARFPIISPHGNIRDERTGRIVDRLVDGGYFENFGALTATELVHEMKKHWLKPVVVLINSEPTTPNLYCRPADRFVPPAAPQTTWLAALTSPFQTVMATRQARGTLAAAALCNEIDDDNRFVFVTVGPDFYNPAKDLSMSWWLSKFVQKHLDWELESTTNQKAFEDIAELRKLVRPVDGSQPNDSSLSKQSD
jgi:hypothetical protein